MLSFTKPLRNAGPALILAATGLLVSNLAPAQVIHLPPVAMTVADCRPGDSWQVRNGVERCQPILPPDTCANHGLYSADQGGGATFVPGVGTCYYAYTPPPPAAPPPHLMVAQDFAFCGAPPLDGGVGVTMYADNTFDLAYKDVGVPGSLVLSGAPWPLPSTPEPAVPLAAVDTLLYYYFGVYFGSVSCSI